MSQASASSKVHPARRVSCRQLAGDVIIENTALARSGVVPAPSAPSAASRRAIWLAPCSCQAHPVGGSGSGFRFGGLSRQQHLDQVAAAFVQLAGEMHPLGDQLGRVGLFQQLGGEPGA